MLGRSLGMRLTYAISIQKFTATYSGGHWSSNIHQNSKTCEMCTGTPNHSIVLIHICPLQSLKWPCSIPNPCVQKMTLHTFILLCELLITTSPWIFGTFTYVSTKSQKAQRRSVSFFSRICTEAKSFKTEHIFTRDVTCFLINCFLHLSYSSSA